MATTLTVNGIVFTFNDSDVQSVRSAIGTQIENTPIKGGPMFAYNYDNDGTSKQITVKGILTAAATTRTSSGTVTTILSQKQWLESLANGDQTEIEFDSEYESQSVFSKTSAISPFQAAFTSTKVVVDGMDFESVSGKPNELAFTIVLRVGKKF
jgi:hypothetical protein